MSDPITGRCASCEDASSPLVGASAREPQTTSHSALGHSAVLILLLVSALLMSACGSVSVTDRNVPAQPAPSQRPSNVAEAPNTQETHDLAISAVDFDPALDAQQIAAGKPYSLFVAVENKGNRSESAVVVRARLLSEDRRQVLLSRQDTVQSLAPGEMKVVRFPASSVPPSQRIYGLDVEVQAMPSEANTANNKRTLQIEITPNN
jgi:hypothetical protein